jgi:hypothetical protein
MIKDFGYTRISFASRMKQIAADVYGQINKVSDYETTQADGSKKFLSGREVLQSIGQVVKEMDRDFWIKYLESDIRSGLYGKGPYVIDDCRFPFEADFLRSKMGFVIVKLDTDTFTRTTRYEKLYGRPPSITELRHPSETEVDKIVADVTIPGEHTPAELARLVVGSI